MFSQVADSDADVATGQIGSLLQLEPREISFRSPLGQQLLEAEVAAMRERILGMRRRLHAVLSARLPGRDFGYFLTQRGMFSYTGLSAAQVDRLREEHGVYLVRSGRMCVAGLNSGNVERTAQAMAAVLG